jgi:hypothetical protein
MAGHASPVPTRGAAQWPREHTRMKKPCTYISLLPGEERTVEARFPSKHSIGSHPTLKISRLEYRTGDLGNRRNRDEYVDADQGRADLCEMRRAKGPSRVQTTANRATEFCRTQRWCFAANRGEAQRRHKRVHSGETRATLRTCLAGCNRIRHCGTFNHDELAPSRGRPRGSRQSIVPIGSSALKGASDVRVGSKADISQCNRHVRFTPESGHGRCFSDVR